MAYKLVVSQSDHGRRLDKTIRSMWPALPLSVVMKGIRTGTVRLDGRKSACDVRVSAGQELYVPWEAPEEKGGSFLFRRTLPVLYRDDWLMVVNKPENPFRLALKVIWYNADASVQGTRTLVVDDYVRLIGGVGSYCKGRFITVS